MPSGLPPTKGTYPARRYRTLKRQAMNRMDGDIKKVMQSLTSVNDPMSMYRLLTEHISRSLIIHCADLLNEAIARTPYKTGQLRSSGRVEIRTGQKQLSGVVFPAIDVRADSRGNWELRRHIESIKRPASLITAEVSFYRVDEGKDIALWAHEDLLPYELRKERADLEGKRNLMEAAMGIPEEQRTKKLLFAVKPGKYGVGTGPKYLEGPFNETKGFLWDRIQIAVDKAVSAYNRKTGQRVRRRR